MTTPISDWDLGNRIKDKIVNYSNELFLYFYNIYIYPRRIIYCAGVKF